MTFGAIVTLAAASLLERSGSGRAELTCALLLSVVPSATLLPAVAVMMIDFAVPTASVGKVIVRLLPVPLHVPPFAVHETKVVSAGNTTLTVTLLAVAPLLLLTHELPQVLPQRQPRLGRRQHQQHPAQVAPQPHPLAERRQILQPVGVGREQVQQRQHLRLEALVTQSHHSTHQRLQPLKRLFHLPGLQQGMEKLPAFIRDTDLNLHFRTFYFDRINPDDSVNEAWAIGGWLEYRSGWLWDTFAMGAVGYTSQPLYAPDDKDGTTLLAPGQEGITVLGQAYGGVLLVRRTGSDVAVGHHERRPALGEKYRF